MVLRDPQVYSELSLKLKKQKLLLNKVRHNSHNLKGDIFENMSSAHDIGLHESNNLVEDILDSHEYVNRKHKSLQNRTNPKLWHCREMQRRFLWPKVKSLCCSNKNHTHHASQLNLGHLSLWAKRGTVHIHRNSFQNY